MEHSSDLQDWELIPGSGVSDNKKSDEIIDEEIDDGTIKSDYFALESAGQRQSPSSEGSDEIGNDSDNPSWEDPDSDSRYRESSRGELGFVGMKPPIGNPDGFWTDESSDGQKSPRVSETVEVENLGNSFMKTASEGADETVSEGTDVRCEGNESYGTRQMEVADDDGYGVVSEAENREKVWWKMPLELLKLCIFRVRPVWSIAVAAAMLGIVMLGRKLYRMKHKSRGIPLRIAMDDKKASQLVARSARLKSISFVRRMPIIGPSLPFSASAQWAALPLR